MNTLSDGENENSASIDYTKTEDALNEQAFLASAGLRADLDTTLLFFTSLERRSAAALAEPLIRYLTLTQERRKLLTECPELAAAVTRLVTDNPDVALVLGLV